MWTVFLLGPSLQWKIRLATGWTPTWRFKLWHLRCLVWNFCIRAGWWYNTTLFLEGRLEIISISMKQSGIVETMCQIAVIRDGTKFYLVACARRVRIWPNWSTFLRKPNTSAWMECLLKTCVAQHRQCVFAWCKRFVSVGSNPRTIGIFVSGEK